MTTVIKRSAADHWRTDGLEIDIDAQEWGDEIARALLKHVKESIMAGKSPSGSPNPPLDSRGWQGKRAAKGLRPKARGFTDKRKFIDSLYAAKQAANKKFCEYWITTDREGTFKAWLEREEPRGADYFDVGPAVDKVISSVVKRLLEDVAK